MAKNSKQEIKELKAEIARLREELARLQASFPYKHNRDSVPQDVQEQRLMWLDFDEGKHS